MTISFFIIFPSNLKTMLKKLILFVLLLVSFTCLGQSDLDKKLGNHRFRFIGPEGNRAIAVAGVPGDPMVNYIGAASGGLWKTTDGGHQLASNFR